MEGLEEKADLVLPWVFLTALSKQRGFFLNPSHHCFSSVRQNDTKSCACPDSICNHMSNQWRVALKPCGEQSGPFPSSISHSHVEKKKLSAEELSSFWTHNCPPLSLQPHYSTIWLQGGKQRKRMKIPSTMAEVDAVLFVYLSTSSLTVPSLLSAALTLSKTGKVQLYKNTVCVHSRWNCMSHPFGFHNVKA